MFKSLGGWDLPPRSLSFTLSHSFSHSSNMFQQKNHQRHTQIATYRATNLRGNKVVKTRSIKVKVFCQYLPWPRHKTIQKHPDRYTTLGQCLRAWWCSFRSRGSCLLPRYSPQIWRHKNGGVGNAAMLHLFMSHTVNYSDWQTSFIIYHCLSIADWQGCLKILMVDCSYTYLDMNILIHTVSFRPRSPPSKTLQKILPCSTYCWGSRHVKVIAQLRMSTSIPLSWLSMLPDSQLMDEDNPQYMKIYEG